MPPIDCAAETSVLLRELEHLVKILPRCPSGFQRGVDFYSFAELPRALQQGTEAFLRGNGYAPSLLHPRTLNEKIFYSKYLTPFAIPTLADKLYANQFVSDLIGKEFVPRIQFSSPDAKKAVDRFKKLPAGTSILKINSGSASNITSIGPDEDPSLVVQRLESLASKQFGRAWGEWHYATIQPAYFIEERLSAPEGAAFPVDYKFYCLAGKVGLVHVDTGRSDELHRAVYTPDFEFTGIQLGQKPGEPQEKPAVYNQLREIAETIARAVPQPFCRVDLYYDNRFGIKFGEVTFTPGNAMTPLSDLNFSCELAKKFKLAGREGV